MSADPRNPKVGDVFISHHDQTVTVTAVGERGLLAKDDFGTEGAYLLGKVAEWQPAPIHPTVAEQWGLLNKRGLFDVCSEKTAKEYGSDDDTPARICHIDVRQAYEDGFNVLAVVCTENEHPIEIAP